MISRTNLPPDAIFSADNNCLRSLRVTQEITSNDCYLMSSFLYWHEPSVKPTESLPLCNKSQLDNDTPLGNFAKWLVYPFGLHFVQKWLNVYWLLLNLWSKWKTALEIFLWRCVNWSGTNYSYLFHILNQGKICKICLITVTRKKIPEITDKRKNDDSRDRTILIFLLQRYKNNLNMLLLWFNPLIDIKKLVTKMVTQKLS